MSNGGGDIISIGHRLFYGDLALCDSIVSFLPAIPPLFQVHGRTMSTV